MNYLCLLYPLSGIFVSNPLTALTFVTTRQFKQACKGSALLVASKYGKQGDGIFFSVK